MTTARPYPWTALVDVLGDVRFEEIRGELAAAGIDPYERDAFVLVGAAGRVLRDLVPDDAPAEAVTAYMALLHVLYLHWAGGRAVRTVSREQLSRQLAASSPPDFRGDNARVNPEETFVAALSACHMLTFLAACARKHLTVDSYEDDAVGFLDRGPDGKLWVARAVLRPRVRFGAGTAVDEATLSELHHKAHETSFIANSIATNVTVEPQY